ncbi:DNA gyrase subunit A [Pseudofulvimonas gallinarii]|jgi:DNA gyrase subunit A|uniref:DNA gyrase subunit A n=1 Tax=Pseudofulvimonas gallinarii TaxID=634155 RepID=A0A4S3KZB5_9GAMM|nr:DNA gyrase subunit A [Pseudofulvimonas gallinarii]TCS96346.1 DNA gyrase subunit A [Pseudofulvimonas gallinarii]THD14742.1 DNA gyrase subunit A [Pseudofulvimonas gallinarii]
MADHAKEVIRVNIEDEMRQSYLDYAMSVIVGRALPDVRDGLKPVHRRSLYAMYEQNNDYNKPFKKSARIVGDVMGKYHPHGDSAIYDTIVRMAQPWSLRYVLVDGQGNFGSIDGDAPAAMRYTEIRMSKLAHELLADIDKETVDFGPNYDESESEPLVLPTRVPNLLINGSAGIAVGMATNIPPHNLNEVVKATLALIDNPDISIDELMEHVPGPDFPTHGIINGAAGIRTAYHTGRGRILIRARTTIETDERSGRDAIIIHELPYQVNKAKLIERIAELHRDKKIEGIAPDGLRDESDKDGMRVVIEVKRGESAEVLLNNLYQQTPMESVFGINMVALVDGQPKLLTLKEMLEAFIRHRREVVTRRTIFELRKARARAHVLEGLTVALANIDEMIEVIKTSPTPAEARDRLLARRWEPGLVRALLSEKGADISRPEDLAEGVGLHDDGYQLSETQAKEILDMRLHRLTGLEQEKLTDEYREILRTIERLVEILTNPERLMAVIRTELENVVAEFGDERRTEIRISQEDLQTLDLIAEENMVVTLSHGGYVKSQPVAAYRAQRRGGRGRSATAIKEEDFVEQLWVANTHDTLLTFTSKGRVFWLEVFRIPQASAQSRGRPIINFLPNLDEGEKINAVLPVRDYPEDRYVFFATAAGVVKKTPLSAFSRPRSTGIWAIYLDDGDSLVDVALTNGSDDILLFGSHGKSVRFAEDEVRPMGRTSRGVRGIRLPDNERVVSMIVPTPEGDILTATARGYGKRTPLPEFPRKGRGTQGVIAIQTSDRNGALVSAAQVAVSDEIMLISDQGTLVRTRVAEVSQVGRNTQGVTLIRLPEEESLIGVVRVDAFDSEEGDDEDLSVDAADGVEAGAGEDSEGVDGEGEGGAATPAAANDGDDA